MYGKDRPPSQREELFIKNDSSKSAVDPIEQEPKRPIGTCISRWIWSSFLNGIKQGKGFSCPVAIVIGAFIIRIWRKSRRATATTAPIEDGAQQYTFHAAHHLDHNPPALDAISYSDDQSRILGFQYDGPQSLPRIRSTIQGFLDAMGAFTIVTKTARQSLKSLGIASCRDSSRSPRTPGW